MNTALHASAAEVMRRRSSVRKYETGRLIPEDTLNEILILAGTAPSSWNLQHWKFVVVREQAGKDRLVPVANNQRQVAECSAVVAVLGDVEADRNAEPVYDEAVRAGYMPEKVKSGLVEQIHEAYRTKENIGIHEAIRNASLGAMQLMLAAKCFGIDSCPMGGFDAARLRKELRIPRRYIPVMLITLGYAAQPAHPSGRLPLGEIVVDESF